MTNLVEVRDRTGEVAGYSLASVMDYCRDSLEAAGFEASGFSNVSESVYFTTQLHRDKLRVAMHACRHPFGVAAQLTIPRAEINGEDGVEPIMPYPYDARDLNSLIASAIKEFMDNAEAIGDEDEDQSDD